MERPNNIISALRTPAPKSKLQNAVGISHWLSVTTVITEDAKIWLVRGYDQSNPTLSACSHVAAVDLDDIYGVVDRDNPAIDDLGIRSESHVHYTGDGPTITEIPTPVDAPSVTYQLERSYIGDNEQWRGDMVKVDSVKYPDRKVAQSEADTLNGKPFSVFFWRVLPSTASAALPLTSFDTSQSLDVIWEALSSYRDDCIPAGFDENDKTWDDVTTAMAWITEALGVDPL
jgi:hypothetical protein